MTESFWFLTGDEPHEPESVAGGLAERGVQYDALSDYAPFQESMRGDRGRPQRAPSTDQKRVRRQIHRSGAFAFEEVNWDEEHPRLKDWAENGEIHRGLGVNLPDDLHRYVHDSSQPQHERARALLRHLSGERQDDRRYGLGMHWSLENNVAEDFAEKSGEHYADVNKGEHADHDFSWGKHLDDGQELAEHMHEHHGVHPAYHPEDVNDLHKAHEHLHRGAPPMPGQTELFPEPPREPKANHHLEGEFWQPHGKPGTAVVIHSPIPAREDIEEHPQMNPNAGGDVYHPFGHGEREVPIRSGASLPISGISWRPMHSFLDDKEDEDYTHHRFDEHPHHEARKTATVLNTQIERLNKGDQIRTPTGQTAEVHKIRPHETDSSLMYLDTDMGTSTVKRGTDFQVVPRNSQQQELPDTGNPMGMGNSAELPGAGRTPGGPQDTSGAGGMAGTCPNCGNTGTLHLQGGMYVCSVCGFSVNAKGSPGNLMFTDQPRGYMPGRRKPGEVPKAHVWAAKYETMSSESQIARRARQVLGGEQ